MNTTRLAGTVNEQEVLGNRVLFTTDWLFDTTIIRLYYMCVNKSAERYWDGLRWHDIYANFHKDRVRYSNNIKSIASTVWEAAVFTLLLEGIWVLRFPLPKPFIPLTSPSSSQSPGAVSRCLATSWSPVQGVLLTVLDLVTEMKRKVSWRRPRPEIGL
jgi:hypothetical protein